MKHFLTLFLLSSSLFAQTPVMEQLTTASAPATDPLATMEIHYGGMNRSLPVGENQVSVSTRVNQDFGVIQFEFVAQGRNGGERTWLFDMPERARQAVHLSITDDYKGSDGLSARLLETSLYFFPRRVLPAISEEEGVIKATLPTGEVVLFDPGTLAVTTGGVLTETAPLDMTVDRSRRKFAQLSYSGNGVMVRVDRRAGTPETVYNQVYNVNEDVKRAIITYKNQTCKVGKEFLWDQNDSRGYYFLFATDAEFFDKILRAKCGWSDLPSLE